MMNSLAYSEPDKTRIIDSKLTFKHSISLVCLDMLPKLRKQKETIALTLEMGKEKHFLDSSVINQGIFIFGYSMVPT